MKMLYIGSCAFLDDHQHVAALHSAFLPDHQPWQCYLEPNERVGGYSKLLQCTRPVPKTTPRSVSVKLAEVKQNISNSHGWQIIAGIGMRTGANQSHEVMLLASSSELGDRLKNSTSWPVMEKELKGLSTDANDLVAYRGKC